MAQQTDGYLKLYAYKSTDTDTQFRDFREQIAGYQVDNIESNFEKLDTIYTSGIDNQVIELTVTETDNGNIFVATLSGKCSIKNNTKITVRFPSILPSTLAARNNLSVTYTDITTNEEKTIVGDLTFLDRFGSQYGAVLADIQPNNIYSIIYNVVSSNNYFILESLKNSVMGLTGITTNNVLAKDTDYSFKDSGIAYTDVLTKPTLTEYDDNSLVVKNTIDNVVVVEGTNIQQDNVYLCDGTRDLTSPTMIKKIDLLSPTDRNRLNLRWDDSEGSILGYIGDYGDPGGTEEQQFLSISKANGCVDKFIYKGNYVNKDGQNAQDGSGANITNLSYRVYRVFTVPGGAIIDIRWSSGNSYIDSAGGKVIGTFSNITLSSAYQSWGWCARTNSGTWETAQVQLDLHTDGTIEAIGAPFQWRRMSLFTFVPQQVLA